MAKGAAAKAAAKRGADAPGTIGHITIVGGGTAGWLTAHMLAHYFRLRRNAPEGAMRITLIESPNIGTVGVGEATVPAMPRVLQQTGVSEQAFFKACNASFKLGVLFGNWNVDAKGKRVDYINPFNTGPLVDNQDPGYYFARYGAGGLDFAQTIAPALDIARACKGPRPLDAKPFERGVGFAYHLDASLFAKMLQEIGTARGVEHVLDDVEGVEQDERGYIAAIDLKERGRFPVELVIDCTGFRGLIINGALGEPFVSYSKHLANDRAMAVQIPHPDPDRIESMTRSTALGAGWVWRVPLYNRIGTGYVFSSAHRTDEEAHDEFVAHLGDTLPKGSEPRVIPMRVGRTRNAWVKNCIAIGLSSGFIEPLESTAIYMIEMAVRWLATYFPDRTYPDVLRDRYNEAANALYDEVRDFICLHYVLGNRTDSQYWIDAREGLEVPDTLATNLELWKHVLPKHTDLRSMELFTPEVYTAVLMGKRVYETGYGNGRLGAHIPLDREAWRKYLTFHRRRMDAALAQLPDHKTLLTHLRGEGPAMQPKPAAANPRMPQATVPLPGLGGAPMRPAVQLKQKPAAAPEPVADTSANLL